MRPDRVIIGEVRGGEALDMVQAMVSGHKGSMSTTHASTAVETMARLETLSLMGDVELPLFALRTQIALALDIIVQVSRLSDGSRKIVQISEVLPLSEDDRYRLRDIFVFKPKGVGEGGVILGDLEPTGLLPSFTDEVKLAGLKFPKGMVDAARKRKEEKGKSRSGSSEAGKQ